MKKHLIIMSILLSIAGIFSVMTYLKKNEINKPKEEKKKEEIKIQQKYDYNYNELRNEMNNKNTNYNYYIDKKVLIKGFVTSNKITEDFITLNIREKYRIITGYPSSKRNETIVQVKIWKYGLENINSMRTIYAKVICKYKGDINNYKDCELIEIE